MTEAQTRSVRASEPRWILEEKVIEALERQRVELVCLATMEPGPLRIEGRLVKNTTEFHYSYLWNETEGVLEGLTSRGSTTTVTEAPPDAGRQRGDLTQRTTFEARLRLVGPASSTRGIDTNP